MPTIERPQSSFDRVRDELRRQPRRWLVTGAAGFIGSNLVGELLGLEQSVIGLDNLATGYQKNVDEVKEAAGAQAALYEFIEGDIRDLDTCRKAVAGADFVLHQAALGSVPRSIKEPLETHAVNVNGFLNMLQASRDAGVRRFVYASSSSVYGDDPGLPKVEDKIGTPLSPYAVTKRIDELYARTYLDNFGLETIGLRYFNVFGPKQDPEGAYAAVIPLWIANLLRGEPCYINGDGETSRDFCYVTNVVQANIRSALAGTEAVGKVYNVAMENRTTLNELFYLLRDDLATRKLVDPTLEPTYREFRMGDIRHSLADTSRARRLLQFEPTHTVSQGLKEAMDWYVQNVPVEKGTD